ncbi:MAG: hypothetical protein QM765_03805 [Myxococcales bacterium]
MANGNRTVFGVGVLSLVLSSCSCNTPPPTTNHLLGEGERCNADDECETALCVALPREDKTCRRSCESGCHSEEICTTFGTGSNGGLRAGCVPTKAGLCLPCDQDTDCPYAADVCLAMAGATFCGRDCSYDEACPEGYACTQGVAAEGGVAPKQCIPKSATCSCIPQTSGMKRPCEVKNSFGTCAGSETCTGEAYENCDARVPAAEACNGVDDNCDGKTDEDMPDVTCGQGECAVTVKACLEGVAQTCTPKTGSDELCNGKDDNCDGRTDEGFDLNSVDRCGSCGTVCTVAHGTPGCKSGACYVAHCDQGWDDCDLKYETGCEANLATDDKNCSVCLNECDLPFASAKCEASTCVVDRCIEGHWDVDPSKPGCEYGCTPTAGGVEQCDKIDNDCNGLTDDGIDLTSDPKNCLGCGIVCSSLNGIAGCSPTGCTIACLPGFADCDPGIPGCETNVDTSNVHCGKCNRACAPANADTFACVDGLCAVTKCTDGFTDCNTNPWDGCEIHTSADPARCGSCTNVCSVAHGTPACNNGQCAIGSCTSPWLNCDGQYATGCNINKETDTDNCGACNAPCKPAANQTAVCGSTGCVRNCATDFLDCNSSNGDGCETSLNALAPPPPAHNCATGVYTELGDVDGDVSGPALVRTGIGEGVFHVGFIETTCSGNDQVTSGQIKLESPPGVSYGMFLSLGGSCGSGTQMIDSSSGGAIKNVCTTDGTGCPFLVDYRDAWIEIVRQSGQGCGQWTLTLTGNIAGTTSTCPF